MNALTVLVANYLSKNNLSRKQLAQNLGYSNISKGLRNLDQYCLTLLDKNQISTKLQKVLNIPKTEYQKSVNQVQSQLENVKRSKFTPSIQVITSSRPSPLFVAGLCPQLWHVEIPDIRNCNFEQELQRVFKAYQQQQLKVNHKRKYKHFIENIEQKEKDGHPYPWTVGKGCRYFRTFDETILFNRYGEITEHIKSHIEPNIATISIGGKTIPPPLILRGK